MNPQNQRSLKLDKRQQKLFDAHAYLIPWVARSRRHQWHPNDFDELLQAARLGLVKACQKANKEQLANFPAFAHHVMKHDCLNRKNRNHGIPLKGSGNNGYVSQQNARLKERSLSDVLNPGEDGPYTRANQVEGARGRSEIQASPGEDHRAARIYEIRQALESLGTLTQFEKKVLKLRFIDGLTRPEVAKRLDCSVPTVRWAIHGAVVKLRVHFHGWGALPVDAPLPASGSNPS